MTECDWCKRDWETCATCESFFNREARCYSDPGEIGCAHYKPFGFCPKCGRNLRKQIEKPGKNQIKVRCKECVFCHYNSSNDTYKCSSMNGMNRTVEPTDYCSYGERKVDG